MTKQERLERIRDEISIIRAQDPDKLDPRDYMRYNQLCVTLEQMESSDD